MKANFGEVSFLRLSKLFTSLVAVASLFGLLDGYSLYFELLVHFRFQYLMLALLLMLIFLLNKKLLWAVFAVSIAILNGVFIAPIYFNESKQHCQLVGFEFKVFHSNVNSSNTNADTLLKQIRIEAPELLVLQEVNKRWIQELSSLNAEYPYNVVRSREDNFGIAIYSRLPILNSEFLYLGGSSVPSIQASFQLESRQLTLITSHTLPPLNQQYFDTRNAQIRAVSDLANSIEGPLVLVGDLNITPWSAFYKPLISDSKLFSARDGFGVIPTWPASFIAMGIPIDHVLVSEHFIVKDFYSGNSVGSDHLPIVVNLSL